MKVRKVSWEYANPIAHPEYYRGERPRVAAAEVPDEHWTRVERSGEGVDDQCFGLIELARRGELIRDVVLYEADATPEPEWREVRKGGQ